MEAQRILKNDWNEILKPAFCSPSYQNLREFLIKEYQTKVIHPDMNDIFNALHYTAFCDVKAVILGQDPYHGYNQAHGLSFSVQKSVPPPPSLINIYKELQSDLGITPPNHGNLTQWANQGVLLLNAVLTVIHGQANSHRAKGWEEFTDTVIKSLNQKRTPVVFIFWGRNAQAKQNLIDIKKHKILCAPHPSPLSAYHGFFGSKPFSQTNDFLIQSGQQPIDWELSP